MDEFKEWRLQELLIERAPKFAKRLLDEHSLQAGFFDWVIESLVIAPISPPEEFVHRPHGLPDGCDSGRYSVMVRLAALSLTRGLARSGFLAFAGLPSEAIGVHRRTIEAILDLELLLDKPDLVIEYERLASEADRKKRTQNYLYKTKERLQSQIKDPNFPRAKLSPLQQSLAERGQDGLLNVGPHSGAFHAATGVGYDGGFGFFDPQSRLVKYMGFRFPWETVQLLDALRPKLTWIDGSKWNATLRAIQAAAREIEGAMRKADGERGAVPPWSSFQPLPSERSTA
jgi:hypothetical protein